jgi:hypothetical protein
MELMSGVGAQVVRALLRVAEILLVPLTFLGGIWLWVVRRVGVEKLPLTRSALVHIGVFPIRDHYHEPQFRFDRGASSAARERALPGLDLNVEGQLEFLGRFRFQAELLRFPMQPTQSHEFYYQNGWFGPGDAEYLYSVVRLVKPRRVLEIGCGFSTLMIRNAIGENRKEEPDYDCLHTCIEPYENPWLEQVGVKLVRERVETLPWGDFQGLERNDILFIDSSHVIRPGGEVLFEYLEILPRLKSGVLVHVHDVFTPFDYPDEWVRERVRLWNEQYLLEALLTGSAQFTTTGALYYLTRRFPEKMAERLPILASSMEQAKPGSFWMTKR